MCTTEVHEVRGGGVGSAATVADGPAANRLARLPGPALLAPAASFPCPLLLS